MMRYLQRLGKSLMLPVACLPVAAILQGIGYWIDPTGWGANNVIAAFLLKGGGCLIDQMPILFAIGVAVGMSDDNDGTAGLAGLVSWIMTTTLLSTDVVAMLTNTAVEKVDPAFGKVQTQLPATTNLKIQNYQMHFHSSVERDVLRSLPQVHL